MKTQAMPEVLRQFLTDLQSEAEVKELHDWLDGNPCAVDEMIETIVAAVSALRQLSGRR